MEYLDLASPTKLELYCLERLSFSKAKANGGTDTPDRVS